MNILSWNIRHTVGASLDEVATLIRDERPDLFLAQEATHILDGLPARVGGHYARHPLPGREHGLAAWSRLPFAAAPRPFALRPGLVVRRICQILDMPEFAVANVHLSHGQILNRRQLAMIFANLPEKAVVMGDCNMVGAAPTGDFKDVGPSGATYLAAALLPLRLDRCFARNLVCDRARPLPRGGSDHRPIMVSLRAP